MRSPPIPVRRLCFLLQQPIYRLIIGLVGHRWLQATMIHSPVTPGCYIISASSPATCRIVGAQQGWMQGSQHQHSFVLAW